MSGGIQAASKHKPASICIFKPWKWLFQLLELQFSCLQVIDCISRIKLLGNDALYV